MLGYAVALDHIHKAKADAVCVFAEITAPTQNLAAVNISPEPCFRAHDFAIEPTHKHVVLVAVSVNPFEGMQLKHAALLRRKHLVQGVLTFAQHDARLDRHFGF
ncbi:Uncharacterised protein [Vibrio cholerae]|nr:Uncharacterised protein [Vibrio cholerae]CSD28320.1 Uncharacterised protein [Vibrio cholerae]